MVSQSRWIELSYPVKPGGEAWVLPEGPVPESHHHNLTVTYLWALLSHWVASRPDRGLVARNLALRWLEAQPKIGIDPDVCWIEPAPPPSDSLPSLCLWKPGHAAPRLAIEVVSENHPYKDYVEIQERYAACGVPELWVVDPLLHGPRRLGGPLALQVWRGEPAGLARRAFTRVHAGGEPYFCEQLGAWVQVRQGRVIVSDDVEGQRAWLTGEEAERAEKEAERAGRLAAEARVRELEAQLAEKA